MPVLIKPLPNGVYIRDGSELKLAGTNGGKMVAAVSLIRGAFGGADGGRIFAYGLRDSLTGVILARLAQHYGHRLTFYTSGGAASPEMAAIREAGGDIEQVSRGGYMSTLKKRAADATAASIADGERALFVPFGLANGASIRALADSALLSFAGIAKPAFRRIVCPIGSGANLAGLLHAVVRAGWQSKVEVIGVRVGADPAPILRAQAPAGWGMFCRIVDHSKRQRYNEGSAVVLGGVELHPYYEAKCVGYLKPGDLFWIVGGRDGITA